MISGVGLKVTAVTELGVKAEAELRWEDKHTTKNTFTFTPRKNSKSADFCCCFQTFHSSKVKRILKDNSNATALQLARKALQRVSHIS